MKVEVEWEDVQKVDRLRKRRWMGRFPGEQGAGGNPGAVQHGHPGDTAEGRT